MAMTWRLAHDRSLTLDRPHLMAILNVTPDSFSDGGQFRTVDDAVAQAKRYLDEGASIIDVGGESTRPGARRVDAEEQIRRALPVIERLAVETDTVISVDTTLAMVAEAALDAGAHLVNDVAAGHEDSGMLPLVAERGAGVILMHRLRPPDEDSFSDRYEQEPEYQAGVVAAIREFLRERATAALDAGIRHESIVIDPGLGFGKTVAQNYEIIRRTPDLLTLGYPLLSALSRKSFLGRVSGIDEPRERLCGAIAASALQYWGGVRLFRVHDVEAHRQALAVARAIVEGVAS